MKDAWSWHADWDRDSDGDKLNIVANAEAIKKSKFRTSRHTLNT